MADLFDFETGLLKAVAAETTRIIDFDWGTTSLYILALLIGMAAGSWLQNKSNTQRPRDAAFMDAGASALPMLAQSGISALMAVALFYILAGRFFLEYIIVIIITLIGSRIYYVIADALMGIRDDARKDKIRVFANVHVSGTTGCIALIFLLVAFAALLFLWYAALMTSFRADLADRMIEARISVLLFAIPAAATFVMLQPLFTATLANRFLDGEVRGFALSRLFPLCLTASVMMAFPVIVFGDVAKDYIAYLPGLRDLIWLPVGLFAVFGLLPYAYGALNHRALISDSVKWQKRWLQQLSESEADQARIDVLGDALLTEMKRMVKRSRYFENYLVYAAYLHFNQDEQKTQEFANMLGMSDGALDGRQFDIIEGHFPDLHQWDRLTSLLDDLFLYWCHMTQGTVNHERIAMWQSKLQSDATVSKGSFLSPIIGTIATTVAGWALNMAYPSLERAIANLWSAL